MTPSSTIANRYKALRENTPDKVTIIAVSKRQPQDKIKQALDCGIRHFGENKVQEAYSHWQEYKEHYPDLTLHLIGALQSNKVKEAVALFDVIHTVDREKIAKSLSQEMTKTKKEIPCFIQVNCGNEEQKSGISFDALDDFYHFCTQECGLKIIGLMAIPPRDDLAAPHFSNLKKAADRLGVQELSMGMSADYEQAIACGSTHIRIGTDLFGARL